MKYLWPPNWSAVGYINAVLTIIAVALIVIAIKA